MSALEQHYKPSQLAKLWALDPDTIRELFKNEVDVLKIERPETMHKRGYTSLRIPASTAERVYKRRFGKTL